MGYKYIGKALSAISRVSCEKTDWAACLISGMSDSEAARLDKNLNYGLLQYKMRNVQTVMGGADKKEIADFRRGLELLQRLGGGNPAAEFDETRCKAGIRNFVTNGRQLPRGGYYLKASALAFAKTAERWQLRDAYSEAVEMLIFAKRTAVRARNADGASRALVRKWFGDADVDAIVKRLGDTLRGVGTTLVGVCYQGRHVSDGAGWPIRMFELASAPQGKQVDVGDGWGWAAPQAVTQRTIGFCPSFFNEKTRKCMVREHDPRSTEMGVTRGGGIVHELTHLLAETRDERVPDAVYGHCGRQPPGDESKRAQGYGPLTCSGLGAVAPELAVNNADNYRLFCEDAIYSKPRS